jgi:hypothetical protein
MLIIDMDTPIYRAAGAAQRRLPDGGLVVDPVHYAYHNINTFINKIFTKFPGHNYHIYMTSAEDKHYRYQVYPEYKAHRKKSDRPVHYKAVREYIKQKHGGSVTVVEDMEADDAIAIHMSQNQWQDDDKYKEVTPDTLIAVYIDKDIHQVPGWRYNYDKDQFYYILTLDSYRHFYTQMFKGDTADNVKNLVRFKQWKPELKQLSVAKSNMEMYTVLFKAACREIRGKNQEEIEKLLEDRGKLLWLQRYKGEMWAIPREEI